jgi:hypothetical protein
VKGHEAKSDGNRAGSDTQGIRHRGIRDKLPHGHTAAHEPAWMQGFGKLKRLHSESVRVQFIIDQEFEIIELEDRR